MRKFAVVMAVMMMAVAAQASISQGMWDLGFVAGFQGISAEVNNNDQDGSVLTGAADANYYFGDNWSVGGMGGMLRGKIDVGANDPTATLLVAMAVGDWYFMTDAVVIPYAGGGVGLASVSVDAGAADDSDISLVFSVHGGGKYFVADNVSIDAEASYTMTSADLDDLNQDIKLSVLSVMIGLTVYFGG